MSQNKTICEIKPTFLLGKRNEKGGLTLGVPLVYSGLMADHTLHTSDGSSHPSQLVVSDYKTGAPSSLVTGENAPLISQNPNINVTAGKGRAGMNIKLNPDKVKLLKSKYPSIRNSSRLNKFFIQSFSKSGNAPTVAQYAKIMKAIQTRGAGKNFQGSPLEYKRILDYFQFTLTQTLNKSNGKLFLYRPSIHKIHENLDSFSNYKEAIIASYNSQNENDFLLYNRAYFATKDRPAALAAVVRGIKTLFKRSSRVEGGKWIAYEFSDNANTNINKLKNQIVADLKKQNINPSDFINRNFNTTKGKITYFLDYEKFLRLKNSTLKATVLFYWMFNYPGDTNGILLQKFVSIIDTFHDFTGLRATGFKPTEGGFTNLWPSGSNAQQKSQRINFNGLSANVILQGNSAFLVQILGRNIYKLAKDNGAASIVGGQNTRSNINSMRKLSHLLYFFANVMGGTKDLTGKCEEYASELLSKTGKIVEKDQICNQLNMGGKHAIVIDIFSTGGRNCIKERSVIHGVGVMDPAPRAGKAWKEVFEEVGSRCVGRGTKGFPVTFEFDQLDEDRIVRLHREYKRQLDEIYRMKGNITTINNKSVNANAEKQYRKINNKRSLGNAVGNKRTRNNNNNIKTDKPNVKRKPFAKVIKPPLTTVATSYARAMNLKNVAEYVKEISAQLPQNLRVSNNDINKAKSGGVKEMRKLYNTVKSRVSTWTKRVSNETKNINAKEKQLTAKNNLARQIKYYKSKISSGTGTSQNIKVWKQRYRERLDEFKQKYGGTNMQDKKERIKRLIRKWTLAANEYRKKGNKNGENRMMAEIAKYTRIYKKL